MSLSALDITTALSNRDLADGLVAANIGANLDAFVQIQYEDFHNILSIIADSVPGCVCFRNCLF